jgi:c-di-AMP phosphodiesterase-like protein
LKNREDYQNEIIYDLPEDSSLSEAAITRLSDGRRYEVIPYVFKIRNENYYFTVFRDTEDYLSVAEREERESTVVAYILLDNLQELTQYVRADYRSASTEVENILKSWISEINGFIKEYENDKYIAVFSKQELDRQMQNDFDIQRRIMSLKIGDNSFPVTISMGIAATGGTLRQKEKVAFDALDIAIKRGGNQVAIKQEGNDGYIFYGGTHKTIENNTSIVSRVSGDILADKIRSATEVLIMGHANPDFDSIGSCVGMARFATEVINNEHGNKAKENRPKVNIVINKNNEAFKLCYEQLSPLGIYDNIFISREDARDLITSNTVLIICDVNNQKIYEAPELAETVSDIAIIDHHRLASALTFDPFLQFVETTKSSASEIVSEILLRSQFATSLHKEEAEVLLSGIMLDTKNFTRNAGAQTFEITHYLYTCGAHTGVVREFFNESLEEIMLTGEFESKARIYRDCVAITWMALDRPSTPEDRVTAAKVADNLLRVKAVEASFALIKMDDDVVISGRSKGEINVQLILERLKGGGHFDIAGAQVKNAGLTKTCEMLKDAIDNYFEYDHRYRIN